MVEFFSLSSRAASNAARLVSMLASRALTSGSVRRSVAVATSRDLEPLTSLMAGVSGAAARPPSAPLTAASSEGGWLFNTSSLAGGGAWVDGFGPLAAPTSAGGVLPAGADDG